MEDLLIFRRKRATTGQWKSHEKPHIKIEIRTGNPEWGAEPNKLYFVIMHGAILA